MRIWNFVYFFAENHIMPPKISNSKLKKCNFVPMKPIFTHIANDSRKAWSYNSDLSLWMSVDPMSDRYLNLSLYAYCAINPVRLVYPDGGSNLEWLFLDEYGNTIGNDVVDDGRRCVWSLSFRR